MAAVAAGAITSGGSECHAEVAPTSFSTGEFVSCEVWADGTLWCWGRYASGDGTGNLSEFAVPVNAFGNAAVQVSAGSATICALASTGTIYCWGENIDGEVGIGDTADSIVLSPVEATAIGQSFVEIAAGGYFVCARRSDGIVLCWGLDSSGELGDGPTDDTRSTPAPVPGLTSVVELAAGYQHACARKSDGTVWCWGSNVTGEIGDGTLANRPSPVPVATAINDFIQLSAGLGHTCGLRSNGTVWCWGDNSYGQLGDGTGVSRTIPGQVINLGGVAQITAGLYHNCALTGDGTVWCWGANEVGQLGIGTTTAQLAPGQQTPVRMIGLPPQVQGISAHNSQRTCARLATGAVWCSGFEESTRPPNFGTVTDLPVRVGGLPAVSVPAAGPFALIALSALLFGISAVRTRQLRCRQRSGRLYANPDGP
jgi:alpha-tubulin suppressor-like RCC1 family protein